MPDETLSPSSTPVEPVSTEVIDATPGTVAGYQALATGLAALFRKAEQVERKDPDASPTTPEEIEELLGDVLPAGVDLAVFVEDGQALTVCLTGPATTFVVLGVHEDALRQVFGRGDCDGAAATSSADDADIVVDIAVDLVGEDDDIHAEYSSRVVKGQNLADQIPELEEFLDVINRAIAG
jgi:hypothetical protein